MFIIDAHLDLSMNAMEWNRDLTKPLQQINERELHLKDKPDRGRATVSLPELRKGNIGLVVATQIARYVDMSSNLPGWHSPEQAWAQTQAQLAWYQAMEAAGEMFQVHDLPTLNQQVARWMQQTPDQQQPIGYILSLEGADSLISIHHLEIAYEYGLRAVGPAHYGPGRYANGTGASGKMGAAGLELLKKMEALHLILDVTHLCDDCFWQAIDLFNGDIWASHNNARALVNHQRQFSDAQIKILIQKGAVIGAALDAWMLKPGWIRGQSTAHEMQINLSTVINHIDHICQLAGNTLHVGIGSDLDGAFGTEQCPYDLDTIADLQKLGSLFLQRGYQQEDIENMLYGNWLRFLRGHWSSH